MPKGICSYESCAGAPYAKGLCQKHYCYQRATGSLEYARPQTVKRRAADGAGANPIHRLWSAMKGRCLNPNDASYSRYGGRGIKVCDRWIESFDAFAVDMGPRPTPQHTLDRIDNDGDYEPGNCEWRTRREQALNRRNTLFVEYEGRSVKLADLADAAGIKYKTVWDRVYSQGWTLERALTTPPGPCYRAPT